MDAADLGAHLEPQLGVEVGERLVHQHQRRLDDDRARDGDALLLAAGELAGQLVFLAGRAAPCAIASSTRRAISAFGDAAHGRPKPIFLRTLMCGNSA